MSETFTVDPDDMPDDATPVAFVVTWTPPGGARETRRLVVNEISPADDRVAMKATGLSTMQLIACEGPMGALGLWWFGGRQDGKRETYAALEPQFSVGLVAAGELEVKLEVTVGDEPAGTATDDVDPM